MEIPQFLQQNIHYILFGVLVVLLFKNRVLSKIYNLESISLKDAYDLYKKKSVKTIFLDVRTHWELENEPKIKKSKSIPLSDLSSRIHEIEKSDGLDKQIIIVCRSGSRARSAGIKLKKAGFSEVYVMSGGIMSWQRADYPLTRPKVSRSFG